MSHANRGRTGVRPKYARPALTPSGRIVRDVKRWQPLELHLRNVGVSTSAFAQTFGFEDLGAAIGRLHDLGKNALVFLYRLFYRAGKGKADAHNEPEGTPGRVDHSTAGAMHVFFELYKRLGAVKALTIPSPRLAAAFAIAFHHGGLKDPETLRIRLEKERAKEAKGQPTLLDEAISEGISQDILFFPQCDLPSSFMEELPPNRSQARERVALRFAFLIYFLYSSLLDADFLDAEEHMEPLKSAARMDASSHAFEQMMKRLRKMVGACS